MVLPNPILSTVKFTVTISPASMAPLAGEKLSAVIAVVPGAIAGVPVIERFNVVTVPPPMTTPVRVTGK